MVTVIHYTKLAIAWIAAITAVVAAIIAPHFLIPAAAVSIAWSLLPEN